MTIRQIARPRPSSSVGWALPPSDDEQVGLKEFHFRPVLVDESDAITKDTVVQSETTNCILKQTNLHGCISI